MSVDYRTVAVVGWRVSNEEHEQMNKTSNYVFESCFTIVDAWTGAGGVIFGVEAFSVEEGEAKSLDINSLHKILQDFNDNYNHWHELLRRCGRNDLIGCEPQLFVINQVY